MAISSVARRSTVRQDNTILEVMSLLGKQQAISGRLAIAQEKQRQAAIKQKNEETSKQFKTLREIDSPYSPYNEQFDTRHAQVENDLLDPNIPYAAKELALTDLTQFSKSSQVVKEAIIKNANDRVGTEEQRKLRNQKEIADAQVAYIQPDGEPIPPTDFDEQKLADAVDNDIRTYNVPNNVEGFMNQQEEVVSTEVSSKNLASGFSRNDVIKQAGKLLVLNDDGTINYGDDGKPTANITGESLAAFQGYSKGNKLAIDEWLSRPANKEKTRLDGMEGVLRENGWLTAKTTTETKLQATPKPSTTGQAKQQQIADIRDRIKLFDESLDKGGENLLRQLKTARGVVASDTGENKTGIKKIPGGVQFTIVQDPSKLLEVPRTFINSEGDEVEYNSLTTKKGKYIVTKIDVMDHDRLPGIIELNAKWDQTVGSKFEVDPVEFVKQYQEMHAADNENPFGDAFSGNDPFKGAFKQEK